MNLELAGWAPLASGQDTVGRLCNLNISEKQLVDGPGMSSIQRRILINESVQETDADVQEFKDRWLRRRLRGLLQRQSGSTVSVMGAEISKDSAVTGQISDSLPDAVPKSGSPCRCRPARDGHQRCEVRPF